jgi:GntR family transcriptional regulator, transcriptional repressor for pyruvate dehydrogenase complex
MLSIAPSTLPLASTSLTDQVAQALRERVESGRYSAGHKLPTEPQLAQTFGVSRTVIREAVSRLKSAGLLESRQGSGVYVLEAARFKPLNAQPPASLNEQAVLQIIEIRRAIEAEAAALAAQRATKTQIQDIQQALERLNRATAQGKDGVQHDVQFHRSIALATGNVYFLQVVDFAAQYIQSATQATRANEAQRRKFALQVEQEHQAIVLAIAAHDSAAAQRAATLHMKNAAKRILAADAAFWHRPATSVTPIKRNAS